MKKTRLSILAAAVLAVAACQPEEQPKTSLSTNAPETITFNSDGTSANSTIMVSTDAEEWNYEMTPADGNGWLSAEKQPQSIVLTAAELDSPVAGEDVTLTITAGNADPVIVTVRQMPADARFDIFPQMQSLIFEPDGSIMLEGEDEPVESVSFSVDCNIPGGWNVKTEPNADWVVIEKEEGVFHVSTTRNDNLEERSEVKLSVVAGEYSKDMTVAQKDAAMMELAGLEDQKVVITFTSGAIQTATIEAGKMLFGCDKENPRLIYSIKADNVENPVYIGRKDNEKITLNFKDNKLTFKNPEGDEIPLGTYSEIQLIRLNPEACTKNYFLESDLDLLGGDEIETNGLEKKNWNTLGADSDNVFYGNFDGKGHKIYNIYCDYPQNDNSSQYISFLGFCEKGEITSVSIMSGFIRGLAHIGGICGVAAVGAEIRDCYNAATIVGYRGAGGICGTAELDTDIINCSNDGDVMYTYNNEYPIDPLISKIGGVVGYLTPNCTASGCTNNGDVTGKENTGGIAGLAQDNITQCHNYGNVQGTMFVGGISGELSNTNSMSGIKVILSECSNSGNVTGWTTVGGISGFVSTGSIHSCFNNGNVTLEGGTNPINAGGIAGSLSYFMLKSEIIACYNTGDVNGGKKTGGVTGGCLGGMLSSCYNTGNVSGDTGTTGGIAGEISNKSGNEIKSCFWLKYDNESGIGNNPMGLDDFNAFSSSLWPSSDTDNWKTGDGEGIYWKSLGEWKGGGTPEGINSTFPKLNWEK